MMMMKGQDKTRPFIVKNTSADSHTHCGSTNFREGAGAGFEINVTLCICILERERII